MLRPPALNGFLHPAQTLKRPLQSKKPMLERQYGQPMVRIPFTCHFMPRRQSLDMKPAPAMFLPKVQTVEEVGRANLVGIVPTPEIHHVKRVIRVHRPKSGDSRWLWTVWTLWLTQSNPNWIVATKNSHFPPMPSEIIMII